MISFTEYLEEAKKHTCTCWTGYKRKPGTEPCAPGSCIKESQRGLWDNIHAKQERIKNGSGEKMRKPGSKGAPTAAALKASQVKEESDSASMDHKNDGRAVEELKAALLSHKKEINAVKDDSDKVYAIINRLMTAIAKAHDISGQQMHDMWVDKYKEIPDTWIMEDAKGYKNPTGGLTQKGRDHYNNATGGHLKAPVTTPPSELKAGSKAANRRKSFCARMSGMEGAMKKPNGEPTRKALALRKWNC
jgi:hypothetical protein